VFAIGLGDASVPFGRIYGGLQVLLPVVAAFGMDLSRLLSVLMAMALTSHRKPCSIMARISVE